MENKFNKDEGKEKFLDLLDKVFSDKEFSGQEFQELKEIQEKYNLDKSFFETAINEKKDKAYKELLAEFYVDGKLSPVQKERLRELQQKLGINPVKAESMEQLYAFIGYKNSQNEHVTLDELQKIHSCNCFNGEGFEWEGINYSTVEYIEIKKNDHTYYYEKDNSGDGFYLTLNKSFADMQDEWGDYWEENATENGELMFFNNEYELELFLRDLHQLLTPTEIENTYLRDITQEDIKQIKEQYSILKNIDNKELYEFMKSDEDIYFSILNTPLNPERNKTLVVENLESHTEPIGSYTADKEFILDYLKKYSENIVKERINKAFEISKKYSPYNPVISKTLPDELLEKLNISQNIEKSLSFIKENYENLGTKIPYEDIYVLIQGSDAIKYGINSLNSIRPNEEQMKIAKKGEWNFDQITTGYAIFNSDELPNGCEVIERIDVMEVFDSDHDAALQAQMDGIKLIPSEEFNFEKDDPKSYYDFVDNLNNRKLLRKYINFTDLNLEKYENLAKEIPVKDIFNDEKTENEYLTDLSRINKILTEKELASYLLYRSVLNSGLNTHPETWKILLNKTDDIEDALNTAAADSYLGDTLRFFIENATDKQINNLSAKSKKEILTTAEESIMNDNEFTVEPTLLLADKLDLLDDGIKYVKKLEEKNQKKYGDTEQFQEMKKVLKKFEELSASKKWNVITEFYPDYYTDNNITMSNDIAAWEEGQNEEFKTVEDFNNRWQTNFKTREEILDYGKRLDEALYAAAEAIKNDNPDKNLYLEAVGQVPYLSMEITELNYTAGNEAADKLDELLKASGYYSNEVISRTLLKYATNMDDGNFQFGYDSNNNIYFNTQQDEQGWEKDSVDGIIDMALIHATEWGEFNEELLDLKEFLDDNPSYVEKIHDNKSTLSNQIKAFYKYEAKLSKEYFKDNIYNIPDNLWSNQMIETLYDDLNNQSFKADSSENQILDTGVSWFSFEPGTTGMTIFDFLNERHSEGMPYLINEYKPEQKKSFYYDYSGFTETDFERLKFQLKNYNKDAVPGFGKIYVGGINIDIYNSKDKENKHVLKFHFYNRDTEQTLEINKIPVEFMENLNYEDFKTLIENTVLYDKVILHEQEASKSLVDWKEELNPKLWDVFGKDADGTEVYRFFINISKDNQILKNKLKIKNDNELWFNEKCDVNLVIDLNKKPESDEITYDFSYIRIDDGTKEEDFLSEVDITLDENLKEEICKVLNPLLLNEIEMKKWQTAINDWNQNKKGTNTEFLPIENLVEINPDDKRQISKITGKLMPYGGSEEIDNAAKAILEMVNYDSDSFEFLLDIDNGNFVEVKSKEHRIVDVETPESILNYLSDEIDFRIKNEQGYFVGDDLKNAKILKSFIENHINKPYFVEYYLEGGFEGASKSFATVEEAVQHIEDRTDLNYDFWKVTDRYDKDWAYEKENGIEIVRPDGTTYIYDRNKEKKSSIVIEDAEWGDVLVVKHGQYNGKSGWYYGLFNQHMDISNVEDNLAFYTDEHIKDNFKELKKTEDITVLDIARQILIDHQDYGWQRTDSEKDYSKQWLEQTGTELSSKDQQEYLNKLDKLLNEKFIAKNKPSLEPLDYPRYVNKHLPPLVTQMNIEQLAKLKSYNEQAGDKMLYDKEHDKLYRLNEYDVLNYEKTHNTDLLNESDLLEMLSFSASEAEDGNIGRTEDDPMIKVNNEACNFFREKVGEINVANIANSFIKSLTDSRKDEFYSPDKEHECRFYCDFDPTILGFTDSLESEDTTYRVGMVFNKGQECVDYFIDRINNSSTIDYDVQVELSGNYKDAFSLAEDHVRRWIIEHNEKDFPIVIDYAFPEEFHNITAYEEPRWMFSDSSELLNILKNNSDSHDTYDEIMKIIKDNPGETFNFDLGKSLVYSDAWLAGGGQTKDYSKESIEEKLDDVYQLRYWNNYDDNHIEINDFEEPIEIRITDKNIVSKLNSLIEEHVQKNIDSWDNYKKIRNEHLIHELREEQIHDNGMDDKNTLHMVTSTLSADIEEALDLHARYVINGEKFSANYWLSADYDLQDGHVKFGNEKQPEIYVHEYIDVNQHEVEKSVEKLSELISEDLYKKISYEFDAKAIEKTLLPDLGLARIDFNKYELLFNDRTTSMSGHEDNFWRTFSYVCDSYKEKDLNWKIENTVSRMLYDNTESKTFNTFSLGEDDGYEMRCECNDVIAAQICSNEISDWETIHTESEKYCQKWVRDNFIPKDIERNCFFGHSITDIDDDGIEINKHTFIYKVDDELAKVLGLELTSEDNSAISYTYEVRGTYLEKPGTDKLRMDKVGFDFVSLATDYSEDKVYGNPLDEKTAVYPLDDYNKTFGEEMISSLKQNLSKKAEILFYSEKEINKEQPEKNLKYFDASKDLIESEASILADYFNKNKSEILSKSGLKNQYSECPDMPKVLAEAMLFALDVNDIALAGNLETGEFYRRYTQESEEYQLDRPENILDLLSITSDMAEQWPIDESTTLENKYLDSFQKFFLDISSPDKNQEKQNRIPIDIHFKYTLPFDVYKLDKYKNFSENPMQDCLDILTEGFETEELISNKSKGFDQDLTIRYLFEMKKGFDYSNINCNEIADIVRTAVEPKLVKVFGEDNLVYLDQITAERPQEFRDKRNRLVIISDETIERFSETPEEYGKNLNVQAVRFFGSSVRAEVNNFVEEKEQFLSVLKENPILKKYVEEKWQKLRNPPERTWDDIKKDFKENTSSDFWVNYDRAEEQLGGPFKPDDPNRTYTDSELKRETVFNLLDGVLNTHNLEEISSYQGLTTEIKSFLVDAKNYLADEYVSLKMNKSDFQKNFDEMYKKRGLDEEINNNLEKIIDQNSSIEFTNEQVGELCLMQMKKQLEENPNPFVALKSTLKLWELQDGNNKRVRQVYEYLNDQGCTTKHKLETFFENKFGVKNQTPNKREIPTITKEIKSPTHNLNISITFDDRSR